jgi:hypothetical protein
MSTDPAFIGEMKCSIGFFKLLAKPHKARVAAALDYGLDCLDKNERYVYDMFTALITATDGELDEELASIFGITPERIAKQRAAELATPPEQSDLFLDPVEARREEARKKLAIIRPISQTAGYNSIIAITAKNSEAKATRESKTNEHGEQIETMGVTMTRRNKRGHASVTVEFEITDKQQESLQRQCEAAAASWRTSTKKMLDYSVIKLTAQNTHVKRGKTIDLKEIETLVTFPLEEWCKLRGAPTTEASLDHERTRAKEDCNTLLHTRFQWEKKTRGGKIDRFHWHGLNPLQEARVENNQISIRLSQPFSAYLLQAPISPYRIKLLSTDERNPNAYALARKLGDYANIKDNTSRKKKQTAENQYKISIAALLDCTSIPKPEKVTDGNYKILIITPFLTAMKEAERVLGIDWGFLSEDESGIIDKQPPKRIEDFMAAYIVYSFTETDTMKEKE